MTKEDLMKVRNLGQRNYDEIIQKLNNIGIYIESEST